MKLENIILIPLDIKNDNNRIYGSGEFTDRVLYILNLGEIFGQIGYLENTDLCLDKVSHKLTNFRILNNMLVSDIEILNTTNGNILKDRINDYVFRPSSIGFIDNNLYVKIDRIITFSAIEKKEDSWLKFFKYYRNEKIDKILS